MTRALGQAQPWTGPTPRVLDPGSWIQDPGSSIQDPGSRILIQILNPGSWILARARSRIQDPGSRIQHPGSRIQDPRSWILDPASGILEPDLHSLPRPVELSLDCFDFLMDLPAKTHTFESTSGRQSSNNTLKSRCFSREVQEQVKHT